MAVISTGTTSIVSLKDVSTLYTWIMYADSITGEDITDNPKGKKFIGFAPNKLSPTPTNNPDDYKWSSLEGTTGTSVKSITTTYQLSNSGTTPPTGTWLTDMPKPVAGQYLWSKIEITLSDNTSTSSYVTSYSPEAIITNGTSIISSDDAPVNPVDKQVWYRTTDTGGIVFYNNNTWQPVMINTDNIKDKSITGNKLADNAINNTDLVQGAFDKSDLTVKNKLNATEGSINSINGTATASLAKGYLSVKQGTNESTVTSSEVTTPELTAGSGDFTSINASGTLTTVTERVTGNSYVEGDQEVNGAMRSDTSISTQGTVTAGKTITTSGDVISLGKVSGNSFSNGTVSILGSRLYSSKLKDSLTIDGLSGASGKAVTIKDASVASNSQYYTELSLGVESIPGSSTPLLPKVRLLGAYNRPIGSGSKPLVVMPDGTVGTESSTQEAKYEITDSSKEVLEQAHNLLNINAKSWKYKIDRDRRNSYEQDKLNAPFVPEPEINYGLIAEELNELGLHEYVQFDDKGTIVGIDYAKLVVPLIEVTKELRNDVDEIKALIKEGKN